MATLTLRIDEEIRNEIEALARGRGATVSDFVRSALDEYLGREGSEGRASGPQSLTLVERQLLSTQHEILARLRQEGDPEREYHFQVSEVLASGFSGEYIRFFRNYDPELPVRECRLVWRILDMFRVVQSSYERLDDAAKLEIGEHANGVLTFRGFDFNDEREARLGAYTKYVVGDGRWREQADAIEREGGNSHFPVLPTYQRMLVAFDPIWEKRVRDSSLSFEDRMYLDVEELAAIYAASLYSRT